MIKVETKDIMLALPNHEEGEQCLVQDEHMLYQYSEADGWKECGSTAIEANLYDMNKQIISQMKKIEKKDLMKILFHIEKLFSTSQYLMLLCHENHYYTLFHRDEKKDEKFIDEFQLCLKDLGKVIQADETPDGAFEFWIKDEDKVFVAYAFNYDGGVIECQ